MPLVVKVCWAAWALVWAAGWAYNVLRGPRTRRRRAAGPFWVLVAAAWWAVAHAGAGPTLLWRNPWALGVGIPLLVAGTAFTLWARLALGSMWTSAPSVKEGHQLHTEGPYAVTRHPIYTGMSAMGLGTALVLGRLWGDVLLVLFLAYVQIKIRAEEQLMQETFGERYAAYRQRTPQLVPGVRRLRIG